MPSINGPRILATDGQDSDFFTVATLALWAGDAQGAEQRLLQLTKRHQAGRKSVRVFESPLVSSAQRTLRQLRRRVAEFRRLGEAANLESGQLAPQIPLQSQGGHLSAIVWAESQWDFELRTYLSDLSWEADFYKMGATLAGRGSALSNVAALQYGNEDQNSDSEQSEKESGDRALEVGWALTLGEMFVRITVSDFCTFTAHGTWVQSAFPASAVQVRSIFQDLLDKFDSGTR